VSRRKAKGLEQFPTLESAVLLEADPVRIANYRRPDLEQG